MNNQDIAALLAKAVDNIRNNEQQVVKNLQQAAERYLDPDRVFEATLKPEPVKP